jgi:S-formylglutathione hydrolase
MTDLQTLGEHACFGGTVSFHEHHSSACDAGMRFAVYVPPQAAERRVPVLYYLAGLTSTEETFMMKGGAQRLAAEHGLMLVAPDTSPRGLGLPGEDDDWDFGTGAGFYLDATAEPF